MTEARWIDRTPTAYAHRAVDAVVGDLPEWFRWGLAWVALLGGLVVTWMLLTIVLAEAVGLA